MNVTYLTIVAVLGAAVGSFVNATVYRLRHHLPLAWDRSVCDHCHHPLAISDLLPTISYLTLRGKCRYCGKKLSLEHPVVEIVTAILFAATYSQYFPTGVTVLSLPTVVSFLSQLTFIALLLILFLYDLKYMELPNRIMAVGLGLVLALDILKVGLAIGEFITVTNRLPFGRTLLQDRNFVLGHAFDIGSPYLYGVLAGLVLAVIFFGIVVWSRERAMGGGDIKLALLLGLILPWPYLVPALYIGFILGAVTGVGLVIAARKKVHTLIPLAPFLVIGTLSAMFFGSDLFRLLISFKPF